jgi:hypothetical protein
MLSNNKSCIPITLFGISDQSVLTPNMATQHTTYTLADFSGIMVPAVLAGLKKHRARIDTEWLKICADTKTYSLDNPKNIYQKEANYHCKSRAFETVLGTVPLHNMLNAGYKLLMDRTLHQVYDDVLGAMIDNENPVVAYVQENLYSQGLGQFLYYWILTRPEICEYMEPIVSELENQAARSIAELDKQPVIEQKTEPWFAARKNTISASVCGYADARACGCDMSKETHEIKEKVGLIPKKAFSWGSMPLRRGQQCEDMTRAFHESIHQVDAKEYGLILDKQIPNIAASPDGVVIRVPSLGDSSIVGVSNNYLRRRLLGRMIEIKNPYSAVISHACEPYYYWQTLQQMKVCRLPACDFVKTRYRLRAGYIETRPRQELPWSEFLADGFDLNDFQENCLSWGDVPNYLSPVIYNNLRWHNLAMLLDSATDPGLINLGQMPVICARLFSQNFNLVSPCVAENLTGKEPQGQFEARGAKPAIANTYRAMPKGFLWCWNRIDPESGQFTDEFRVEFTLPTQAISPSSVPELFQEWDARHQADGYRLFECFMWNLTEYQNIEIEYNQGLYEGWPAPEGMNNIQTRLATKWGMIQELRALEDMTERWRAYAKYYPFDRAIPDYVFDDPAAEEPATNASDWDLD